MKIKRIEIQKVEKNNFLLINDYVWMWDTTQEKLLQKELAKKSYGDVLVAGYGLGLVQKYLLENPKVKSVTTLEIYKEIIEECKKKFGKIYGKIIVDDFYDYDRKKYDCIIGDIWPDIAKEFLKDYVKFKKKSKTLLKKDGRILAWGGDFFEYLLKKPDLSLSRKR
jgi:spermidine synthase